jgi:hypothetical protein
MIPQCKNPQHPIGRSRTMLFLEQKDHCFVFACQACKDMNRKLSVQVLTESSFRQQVRKDLAKQGRLLTEAPPIMQPQMRSAKRPSIDWQGRRSRDGKYELVLYKELGEGNLQVQMAIDGRLAPMMDDHIASREEYRTDEQYFTRVAQSSELMLHLYGDARTPLTPEESSRRQGEAF